MKVSHVVIGAALVGAAYLALRGRSPMYAGGAAPLPPQPSPQKSWLDRANEMIRGAESYAAQWGVSLDLPELRAPEFGAYATQPVPPVVTQIAQDVGSAFTGRRLFGG